MIKTNKKSLSCSVKVNNKSCNGKLKAATVKLGFTSRETMQCAKCGNTIFVS